MSAAAGPATSQAGEAMREALARTEQLGAMVERHLAVLHPQPPVPPAPSAAGVGDERGHGCFGDAGSGFRSGA